MKRIGRFRYLLGAAVAAVLLGINPTTFLVGQRLEPRPSLPSDSTYSNLRVRALVESACLTHAKPPEGLASFTSDIESEIALLVRGAEGDEITTQVEQFAGRVGWLREGRLVQTVTGHRTRLLGPGISMLTVMRRAPWVIAPLYGDRVPLIWRLEPTPESISAEEDAERGEPDENEGLGPPTRLVHPFASDRAEFYRFSGGDTVVTLRLPERVVPLVRVFVEAVDVPATAMVFEGEIDIDATRHRIVRMRGQLLGRGRTEPRNLGQRLLFVAMKPRVFIALENAEYEEKFWLPLQQQFEIDVNPTFSAFDAVMRIRTDLRDLHLNETEAPGERDAGEEAKEREIVLAYRDSLASYSSWFREIGEATGKREEWDFAGRNWDLSEASTGPRIRWGGESLFDALSLRFDRVEGLFTGTSLQLEPGEEGPDIFFRLHGGYAWAESTVRGGALAGIRRDKWEFGLEAGRELASTYDFVHAFSPHPTLLGLFGDDDFHYVDRYSAGVLLAHSSRRSVDLELSAGFGRDQAPHLNVASAPLGGDFHPLRPVREGSYRYARATAEIGGLAGGEFLSPGTSARLTLEAATGSLQWRRLEASLRNRREWRRWSLSGKVTGGIVASDSMPPQTLFEVGGYSGDRALVFAAEVSYVLPIAEGPIRLGPLFLPSIAPSPTIRFTAGGVDALQRAASPFEELDWTDRWRAQTTLFLGARFLGGAVRIGFLRDLGVRDTWRFKIGLNPGL